MPKQEIIEIIIKILKYSRHEIKVASKEKKL